MLNLPQIAQRTQIFVELESSEYGNKKEYEPTADGLTARNEGYTHAEWDASAYRAEG